MSKEYYTIIRKYYGLPDYLNTDPSVETVMKGAAAMAEFEPDWIVAIGGGSPIQCNGLCGAGSLQAGFYQ